MTALRLWACGGAGANICKQVTSLKSSVTNADLNPVYVDTSDANYRTGFEKESIFVIPNVAGSGKLQSENIEEIKRAIPELLLAHEPADFNIVLFSTSGGSGSTTGTLLMAALLEAGHPAIAVTLGTMESSVSITNTMNTFRSLNGIVRQRKVPISMFYHLQEVDKPEQVANDIIISAISCISLMASQLNDDLDKRDIHNFVFYPNVTKADPTLLAFDIIAEDEQLSDIGISTVVSMVDILPNRTVMPKEATPFYRTVGYADVERSIALVTTPDLIKLYVSDITEHKKTAEAARASLNEMEDLFKEDSEDETFF